MNTQHTFMLYRKSKRSILCLLTWHYYQPSLALQFDCSLQCVITNFFYLTVTDSMYEVTLVREDLDGNSFPAAAEFQASEAPQPPAPVNLHLTMSTVDSISVQWYQPHSDMEILQYTIKYYELLRNDIHGNSNIQTR